MRYKTGVLGKIYLWIILALLYLPIVTVVAYSFNDAKSSAEWVGFTLNWYRKLFTSGKYGTGLKNSLLIAVCSVAGAGVIGTSAAVGAASRKFRTRGAFESLSILPIMIPEIIMGMSLLSVFTMADIPLGLGAIILAHITFRIPYVYLVVRSRLSGIDKSVVEAARDLGAGRARAFLTVTVPLLAPALGGGCLLGGSIGLGGGAVATGHEAGDVLPGLTDDDERILDGDLVALLPQELEDSSSGGGGNLHRRLVRFDGREGLVDGDGVAFCDHPLDDDA